MSPIKAGSTLILPAAGISNYAHLNLASVKLLVTGRPAWASPHGTNYRRAFGNGGSCSARGRHVTARGCRAGGLVAGSERRRLHLDDTPEPGGLVYRCLLLNSKYGPLSRCTALSRSATRSAGDSWTTRPTRSSGNRAHVELQHPAGKLCYPGQTDCDSYNTASWLGITPLKILSVTFANGSASSEWAVTSDLGGTAEVSPYCPAYGGPYCTYPWYASNSAYGATTYGADYPGTKSDYGQGSQFPVTMQCGGPLRARLHLLRHGTEATAPLIAQAGLPCKAVRDGSPATGSPAADSSPGSDRCHGVAPGAAVPTGAVEGSAAQRRGAP